MSTPRILVSFCLLVLIAAHPVRAVAADSTAKDFVTAIYRNYEGKDAKGLPLNSPKIRALISPGLLKLIEHLLLHLRELLNQRDQQRFRPGRLRQREACRPRD